MVERFLSCADGMTAGHADATQRSVGRFVAPARISRKVAVDRSRVSVDRVGRPSWRWHWSPSLRVPPRRRPRCRSWWRRFIFVIIVALPVGVARWRWRALRTFFLRHDDGEVVFEDELEGLLGGDLPFIWRCTASRICGAQEFLCEFGRALPVQELWLRLEDCAHKSGVGAGLQCRLVSKRDYLLLECGEDSIVCRVRERVLALDSGDGCFSSTLDLGWVVPARQDRPREVFVEHFDRARTHRDDPPRQRSR